MATAASTPATAAIDDFSCPSCGAAMVLQPGTSQLVCDHCGQATPITLATGEIDSYDLFGKTSIAALGAADASRIGREVECKHCGARAVTMRRAEHCAFCDAPMVVEVDAGAGSLPPGGVMPFVVDGKQAAAAFARWLRRRWFAPRKLAQRAQRERMDGVYLPFWAFDATSETQYDGQRGKVTTRTETYTDGSGQTQTRTVQDVDWTPVSGVVTATSHDVLAAATSSLPERLTAPLLQWPLDSLRVFDPRFLAGFVAERYRIEPSDGFTAAYPRIEGHIDGVIRRDIGGDTQRIDSKNIDWKSVEFRHVLLPLWLSAFHFRGKVFHVAVNAVSGDVVGERPWSIAKLVPLALAALAGLVALVWKVVDFVRPHSRFPSLPQEDTNPFPRSDSDRQFDMMFDLILALIVLVAVGIIASKIYGWWKTRTGRL